MKREKNIIPNWFFPHYCECGRNNQCTKITVVARARYTKGHMTGDLNPAKRLESRIKISAKTKGRVFSDEMRQRFRVPHPRSEETNRKLRESGRYDHMQEFNRDPEMKRRRGIGISIALNKPEVKEKMRINTINRIKESGGYRIGRFEKQILDKHANDYCLHIDRDICVAGFRLDGYNRETNTMFEVDEEYHFNDKQVQKDLERENIIKERLGCNVVRIKLDGSIYKHEQNGNEEDIDFV